MGLRTLVVDDEQPARDELVFLLGRDDRIGAVDTARSGAEALRRSVP
ncbi:MAG: DNA-binding response regulator, partial [Actinomycetales bacterium]